MSFSYHVDFPFPYPSWIIGDHSTFEDVVVTCLLLCANAMQGEGALNCLITG